MGTGGDYYDAGICRFHDQGEKLQGQGKMAQMVNTKLQFKTIFCYMSARQYDSRIVNQNIKVIIEFM
jgi:hypothetical protein